MVERLRSIAQLAVEAQTASDAVPANDVDTSPLEELVADIESDLEAVNAYLGAVRRGEVP
jgi:hypothetical protein